MINNIFVFQIENLDLLLAKLTLSFPNLEYLSLLGNPACPDQLSSSKYSDADYQKYRYTVSQILLLIYIRSISIVQISCDK